MKERKYYFDEEGADERDPDAAGGVDVMAGNDTDEARFTSAPSYSAVPNHAQFAS